MNPHQISKSIQTKRLQLDFDGKVNYYINPILLFGSSLLCLWNGSHHFSFDTGLLSTLDKIGMVIFLVASLKTVVLWKNLALKTLKVDKPTERVIENLKYLAVEHEWHLVVEAKNVVIFKTTRNGHYRMVRTSDGEKIFIFLKNNTVLLKSIFANSFLVIPGGENTENENLIEKTITTLGENR